MRTVANGEEITHGNGSCPFNGLTLYSPDRTKHKLKLTNWQPLPKDANIEIGEYNEQAVLQILEEFFKCDLYKDEYKYAKHDFYNNEYKEDATISVEVKSRVDLEHNLHETGWIDRHKVDAQLPNIQYHYVFIYRDGIYYTPYDKKRFDGYDTNTTQTIQRVESNHIEKSLKIDIPREDLQKICGFKFII